MDLYRISQIIGLCARPVNTLPDIRIMNLISGWILDIWEISGCLPDICPNIRTDTGRMSGQMFGLRYPVGRMLNFISGRIKSNNENDWYWPNHMIAEEDGWRGGVRYLEQGEKSGDGEQCFGSGKKYYGSGSGSYLKSFYTASLRCIFNLLT